MADAVVSSMAVSFQKSNKLTSEYLAMPTRKDAIMYIDSSKYFASESQTCRGSQCAKNAQKYSKIQYTTTHMLRIQLPLDNTVLSNHFNHEEWTRYIKYFKI